VTRTCIPLIATILNFVKETMLKKLIMLPQIILIACLMYAGAALALDTPRDLRGTEVRQNTVKWEWSPVSGASAYEVIVNGKSQGPTSDSKFFSYNLPAGEHRMRVKAVAGDGSDSAFTSSASIVVSETFSFGSHGRSVMTSSSDSAPVSAGEIAATPSGDFGAPSNPRGTETSAFNVTWEWDAVSGAKAYEVTVDGGLAGQTNSTSWESNSLWKGGHSMTVKAIDSSERKSAQSKTATLQVTGAGGEPANSRGTTTTAATGGFGSVQGLGANEYADREVRLTWNAVEGAAKYQVTIDGQVVGDASTPEWVETDMWIGQHSATVIAVKDSGERSVQSETLKFSVSGNGSGPAEQVATQDNDPAGNDDPAPPPAQNGGGDPNAANVQSLIDPASYNYPAVTSKEGYELVFSDEFTGTSLNSYRWHSQLRWDGEWNGERFEYRIINGEDQFYVNVLSPDPEHQRDVLPVYNPFKFDGNHLTIQASLNPLNDTERRRTHGKLNDIVHQQPFLSGAISTHEKFSQKYGYFEARIKIPNHVGTFPAFWLFHERRAWEGTQRTEIDIMENLGHAPEFIYNSFHYFKNVSRNYSGDANFIKPKPSGQISIGKPFSDDYHVYAVDWSPGKITWFVDGQKVSELYEGQADYEELYVMVNLAMGGNWTNFPKSAGGLGRSSGERYPTQNDIREFSNPALKIDYVRVYKRK